MTTERTVIGYRLPYGRIYCPECFWASGRIKYPQARPVYTTTTGGCFCCERQWHQIPPHTNPSPLACGHVTPWGHAEGVTNIGDGVCVVSTSGHGGYYVPDALLEHIPAEHRRIAASWSGSESWYEEDCCWAYVAQAFPHLFPPEAAADAESVAKYLTAR